MIEKIKIRNFKNIKELVIPLEAVNVLVGANNAGKSSILQAIQFAISIAQTTTLENTWWRRNSDVLPTSLTPEQLIYSPIKNVYKLGHGGKLDIEREKGIQVEFWEQDSKEYAKVLIRRGKNKNIATEIHNQHLGERLRSITDPFSVYVPGLAGIPSYEEFRSPGILNRAAARGDANNYFRNILYQLKSSNTKWKKFENDFTSIFPNVKINVDFAFQQDEHIEVSVDIDGKNFPVDAAGTGVLQTLQILSYINLYQPKILILDEPDSHLHPNNQRLLAEKLHELAIANEFQIILSTHSRHLLYSFEDLAKINWISNGKIVEEDINIINVLIDLGALDKGDFLRDENIKLVVLSEDSDTNQLEQIIKSSGFNDSEFEIWSYDGCSDIKTANVLAAFIKKNSPNIKIALHRDRDYLTQAEIDKIFENLKEDIEYPFVTDGYDVESHYLNAQVLSDFCSELGLDNAQRLIDQAISDTYGDSFSKLLNTLTDKSLKNREGHNAAKNAKIATEFLNDNPIRYSYSKKTFKRLKKLFQDEGIRINLEQTSEGLKSSIFVKAKEDINIS
ncbi:AAA family ATPase [Cellulophaga baltica]|uniref:AAA family ATPase n=1 Tax=Cellulophaga baltica TaxID=76594 RepID=UPI002494B7F7|nr:AAA family ATPase [Cellulophaga baltica]